MGPPKTGKGKTPRSRNGAALPLPPTFRVMTDRDEPRDGVTATRILMVEDSASDAELITAALRQAGLAFASRRVETESTLWDALQDFAPDVVLTDHTLPGFSGRAAIAIVHAAQPHTPVIVVTGSLDEEVAAEYIKGGAVDYVVKHRLFRLAGAVRRAVALRDALSQAATATAALQRSEERFRRLVEYSSDVVTLLDATGRILYSSQSLKPTLGYAAGEMTGESVFPLVHTDDAPAAMSLFREVLQGESSVHRSSFRIRHKNGSWRHLDVVAANHLDDPVVEAIVVNYHDVTDRKRAEAALNEIAEQHRQAAKMEAVGRLASGVAHDFNNLLTVVTTCCELLLERIGNDPPTRADAVEILQAAQRGAALTRQLLAFSRDQEVSPQRVDLNELVTKVTGMLTRLMSKNVTLRFTPAPSLDPIWADPGQLEQVVMNLAVNARDAMPQGGVLTIETRSVGLDAEEAAKVGAAPGAYAGLLVRDTGSGMDAETRAHIFEPFFTTKPKGQGTGLGLATVYGIVERAGGAIVVDTEVGAGTTFTVYLPHERRAGPRGGAGG